ncbi:MAG: inositol monophosphatase family protein [Bacteroidetes bacterium]|nr:inositol monophosphatase family protein [Bacteroidota bacterium]
MDYKNLCEQVCEISKTVGEFIHNENRKITAASIEIKGKHDFVTYVDKASEKKIIDALTALLPDAGYIAEENTSVKVGKEFNWIIDPLDGTTNFIHGLPLYAISIALQQNDEIVLGVVYEINLKECFYAWKDSNAYLNGNVIKVSDNISLNDSLIATGFPYYDYERLDEYMQLFVYLLQNSRGVRRLGSAAVDLVYVACGRFEAFYEYGLRPWDVAAGSFIVQQAGGLNYDFKGGDNFVFGKEIISCNSHVADELLDICKKYF